MRSNFARRALCAAVAPLATACATSSSLTAPEVPAALRPPAGEVLFLETTATGVQVYECTAKSDPPKAVEWVFRAPEATLFNRSGNLVGRHYAGPTWQWNDASTVVGEVKERAPGATASAVPWLLLSAKSTSGSGVLGPTTSIQRVKTVGGGMPHIGCTVESVGQKARVPYSAVYYFYRAGP